MKRALRTTLVAVAAAGALSGCSLMPISVNDLPLPGGADVGDNPYEVTVQFSNVLNLVQQSAVKVNDVTVGRVTGVSLPKNGWRASVTVLVHGDVRLPADSYAYLRQSSLLGEKYIELAPPPKSTTGQTAGGRLVDGATIPAQRTNRNPEVEEVLGALSMLLNGGGLNQMKTITTELNKAFNGNEAEIKSMLQQIGKLTGSLDANRKNITAALDGVNRLSATLAAQRTQISTVLEDLGPGLKVLEEQRGALVRMLQSLDRLSGVAVDTINRSRDDMIADLKAMEPTLRRLADAGADLPNALQVALTYPFTDAVLPAIKGDYLNVYLKITAPNDTVIIPPVKRTTGSGSSGSGGRPTPQHDDDPLPLPLPSATGPEGGRS
ncbi:MCE family protein [Thermomonospora umbrina]|uniref:Phospholipid/cholesterol/gamma-HCH transport system substrate-binding protein n=1 Tax=Thermomonospora umbrina TaxID=111806 RepID=A0A3D9T1W0_9ACTN|nr:MCE family protein [Thermomonospora umbrina]REE97811.1 phospholipid/cholesterol/gamma-HCH transport system substrate-binding protein [Thermomonospora umbrina]